LALYEVVYDTHLSSGEGHCEDITLHTSNYSAAKFRVHQRITDFVLTLRRTCRLIGLHDFSRAGALLFKAHLKVQKFKPLHG
jgi:hypothetical protein